MKTLHTSDLHIGHKLYGRQRYHEFSQLLEWLAGTIEEHHIEALIIAGDIFDSQTPSNHSLKLYYHFLSAISLSCCRHVILVGGNHDSPTLLNAPRDILSFLNIHVIGRAPDTLEDEIIILEDKANKPELMVLAVPYLRDKDIRSSEAGESLSDKQNRMLQGIRNHYFQLTELALEKQKQLSINIPLLATGHLFCKGGQTRQGDGVRELYVGTLVQVGLDTFPTEIDYLALGHLHLPQMVSRQENRRYSGAPLAMSFSEAEEQKHVLLVTIGYEQMVQELPVPCFQKIQNISGNLEHILEAISTLALQQQSILLEINYQGTILVDELQEQVYAAVKDTDLEVLRISNQRRYDHILQQSSEIKTLEELTPRQVFEQCLDLHEIPNAQQQELMLDFKTALDAIMDEK
ncbi:MAG: exonuclease SbcCD subunit D C-terminal domain-containing protein [Thermodesulfobacteriota bacterium]|nr:exonuclease SbcCD subunit D C-terminal domain-containing protein [Thermodesulfobacteriota bacterium]